VKTEQEYKPKPELVSITHPGLYLFCPDLALFDLWFAD
jgi:hypothetical protein